jgi:hypothetical protein
VRPISYSWVRHFVLVQSAIVLLQAGRRNRAIVVIGGVDVVSILRVILRLPRMPQIDQGRSR